MCVDDINKKLEDLKESKFCNCMYCYNEELLVCDVNLKEPIKVYLKDSPVKAIS